MRGYIIAALIGVTAGLLNASVNLMIMRQKGAGIGARDIVAFTVVLVLLPLLTVGAYVVLRALLRAWQGIPQRQ